MTGHRPHPSAGCSQKVTSHKITVCHLELGLVSLDHVSIHTMLSNEQTNIKCQMSKICTVTPDQYCAVRLTVPTAQMAPGKTLLLPANCID